MKSYDTNTGEVLTREQALRELLGVGAKWYSKEQVGAYKRIKEHERKEKHIRRTPGDKFTNGNMDAIRQLRSTVDDTTLGYVLYLQIALQYDGKLGTSKRRFTKVKDFEVVLGVGKYTTIKVINKLRNEGVLYLNDAGVYCMNRKYHCKGEINSYDVKKNVKVMDEGIKALRDASVKVQDLGTIYALLPYIRFESNAIVHNPHETDMENLKKMNLEDIAGILNYDNAQRVSSKLCKITFIDNEWGKTHAFAIVQVGNSKHVRINPLLVRRVAEKDVNVLINESTMIDYM